MRANNIPDVTSFRADAFRESIGGSSELSSDMLERVELGACILVNTIDGCRGKWKGT